MKRLDVLTLNESERWDSLVKGFKQHDVYYLSIIMAMESLYWSFIRMTR
jgi:hypothetical protein